MKLLTAVLAYLLLAVACGFALGAVRELVLTPWAGPAWATAMELPVILTALWFGCGFIVRRVNLPRGRPRWAMGGLWFVLFLATELAFGALVRGWSVSETVAHFTTLQGAMGLFGFTAAALFPVWAPQR